MSIEQVAYINLPNCLKISNGTVEVVVTTDMGPRVIRYEFMGEENVFAELPELAIETELGEFRPLGGHRLWHAPEAMPRSYSPDNEPVAYEALGDLGVKLTQRTELETWIQKEMEVRLAPTGS